MKTFSIIAKTSFGFEEMLMEELRELGAVELQKGVRAVFFKGTLETLYTANLFSRIALRFLVPIKTMPASSEVELYDEIKKIDWSEYLTADETLAIDAVTNKSNLSHSLYVSLKTKDAIVDQFRDKFGKRPNVDLKFPKIKLNVHISENVASVSLDSSAESLHKRGYRLQQGEAPLNETLAAGMIKMSGWDCNSPLLDIMCGSGTILIEAAMMARNIPPGILRKEFGFERWNNFDSELWENILENARKKIKPKLSFKIVGVDRSAISIKHAKENAKEAMVSQDITFHSMPFESFTPEEKIQTIITNPPYGGRITDNSLFDLYAQMGDQFKKKYEGSTAWVFTANKEAAKKIGLHASRKIQLYNGSLECRLMKYDLYKGTKKGTMIKDHDSQD